MNTIALFGKVRLLKRDFLQFLKILINKSEKNLNWFIRWAILESTVTIKIIYELIYTGSSIFTKNLFLLKH